MSKPLSTFFRANPQLDPLMAQARQLRGWQLAYERLAPASLVNMSRIGNVDANGWLTILADNGAVAAKLRQLAPELLDGIRAAGCPAREVRVRVDPTSQTAPRRHNPNRISQKGRRNVREFADTLPDSPLRQALERLLGKC